jgi:hypothetical protein
MLGADSGAALNMVPRSDSHFGLGAFVPVLEAVRRGIQDGLSYDNEISYGYDLFTEMRVLLTVERGPVLPGGVGRRAGRAGPLHADRRAPCSHARRCPQRRAARLHRQHHAWQAGRSARA